MADLRRTLEVFSKLSLQDFPAEWVKSLWDNDFTDIDPLDIAVEGELEDNGYQTAVLKMLQSVFEDWKSNKEGKDGAGFWSVLVENEISHKNMIALFAYLMDIGSKKTSESIKKEAGILSASCYVKMLSIPGSVAFKIFHPVLYEKTVDLIKMISTLGGGGKRKKSMSPVQSQKVSKRGRGNKTKNQDPTLNLQDFGSDDDDSIEEMAPQEINTFRNLLMGLIQDLISLLETTSLRQSESSAYHTVQILSALTRQDTELYDGQFDKGTLTRLSLPGLAYRGLSLLCKPLHGHVGSLVNATCKYLLPNLLMLIGDNKVAATTIPKHIQVTREHAMYFISYLLKTEERSVNTVKTLLQHMCTKVPDKSEYRGKVAQSVVTILKELPNEAYGHMVEWFYKLSKHSKINNRAFAMEIVLSLLSTPEREADENITPERAVFIKHTSLLGILLARCSDIAPTVRTRAISSFSTCFQSHDKVIKETLKEIVTPQIGAKGNRPQFLIQTPAVGAQTQSVANAERSTMIDAEKTAENLQPPEVSEETPTNPPPAPGKTPFHGVYLTPFNPNMTDSEGVTSMFRRRAKDPKVNVRKAALQALENIIRFQSPDYSRQDLDVLVERCRDPALSVRKQAMQSLTDLLLELPTEKPLQKCWLDGVMPLVIDRETTLQEKCMEQLEEIIIHNIVPIKKMNDNSHKLAWEILNIMTKPESVELRRYMQKACGHWSRLGKIKPTLIANLQTYVNTDFNEEAWMLLAELAPAVPKMCHGFVMEYWDKQAHLADVSEYETLQRVLSVMGCSARFFPDDKRDVLIEYLKNRLLQFNSPPELISITIDTLSKLCEAKAEATKKKSEKDAWCVDLLKACDNYLSHVILEDEAGPIDEDMVVRHLFTLGEIAQICPAKTPKRVFLIVQSMIAAPCISAPLHSSQEVASQSEKTTGAPSQASTRSSTGSTGSNEDHTEKTRFSQQTQGFSQIQLTQAFSQFQGSKMSNRIRAFAFIALGKLCLQNPDLAKKCVAALARELETCRDPTIRNNVVIIMCDLCVRYTTTADRYVSNIAACLKDESPLVRKQTLTLITRLLQEDFLKWKGVLFFRFIMTLLDTNKEIADFAEFCLVHLLLQRHPTMFFQHFQECIFHFNAYEDHATFNKFPQNEKEKRLFCLKGNHNASKRLKLYLFMIEYMTDEQRFQMTAKMAQEVLGGVVDNIIPLNEASSALLKDTLAVLSSKEIKLSSLKAKPQEEIAGDEEERAAVVMAAAKKTLITQVVKKNVIENIVPIVVSLKHMLEQQRSPVLKDLMMYLRELMKDYKNEVQEILAADRQLANEIEFDLRKFEEQEEELERQRNTVSTIVQSPARAGSPAPKTGTSSKPGSPQTAVPQGPEQSTGSPARTPAHAVGSPEQETRSAGGQLGVPTIQVHGPTPIRTPARDTSLSTKAILNSARKAFERAQQLHDSLSKNKNGTIESSSPTKDSLESSFHKASSRRKSILKDKNKESEVEDDDDSPQLAVRFADNVYDKATPPRVLRGNRAISTPSGVLNNITFHADQNVTLIPPSPIPTCMPVRVFGDASDENGTPATPQKVLQGSSKDTVYMFSPDKPLPKPKKWNVKSPASKQAKTVEEVEKDESLNDNDENEESTKKKTVNPTTKTKRATRRSTRKSKS